LAINWLKRASGLSSVLNMALDVVTGGGLVHADIRRVLLDLLQPNPLEKGCVASCRNER
jgi:hypothetical protein